MGRKKESKKESPTELRARLEAKAAVCLARVRDLWPELVSTRQIEDQAVQLMNIPLESLSKTRAELEQLLTA